MTWRLRKNARRQALVRPNVAPAYAERPGARLQPNRSPIGGVLEGFHVSLAHAPTLQWSGKTRRTNANHAGFPAVRPQAACMVPAGNALKPRTSFSAWSR